MSILSLDEARAQLKIEDNDDTVDALLRRYLLGIDRTVELHVRRVPAQRTVTEDLELCGRLKFRLGSRPVMSLTSLDRIDGSTSYDVTKLLARPDGLVRVISGPNPTGVCTAVYEAGYAPEDVPANYKEGAAIILQHVWETQRGVGTSASGVMGAEEEHARAADVSTYSIPHKAREWLGPQPTMAL